jgi:hypothetical protein
MKRYLYIAACSLAALTTYAQQNPNTEEDAVRLSQDNLTGTARFRAMSGAFGALGGDLSSININPAGSAIFNYNSATGSLTIYNISNTSKYFGTTNKQNDSSLDLNQLGIVFVFNNTKENAAWQKFAIAFNYENTSNLDNSIYTSGVSPNSNIERYFSRYLQNRLPGEGPIAVGTIANNFFENLNYVDQQAYLGYEGFVFDPEVPDDPTVNSYVSNVTTGNVYKDNSLVSTGYNGKVAFNIAGQLKERFYLGLNLNVHFTDYLKTTSYYEEFNNAGVDDLQWTEFNNERYTYGGGFSLNLGGIMKVTEALRLGLAYESPTWYRLQDELRQNIVSNVGGEVIVADPGVVMVMDDYSIQTPAKYTGSLAYVFGKNGLISADLAFRDHSTTKFGGNRSDLVNNSLSETLHWAGELRVGAEYRIKNVSLRGGYRYEQSPYKDGKTIGDLTGFSGGLGFAFPNSRLDLAYSWYRREADMSFLTPSLSDATRINSNNNNVTLSYTIDL